MTSHSVKNKIKNDITILYYYFFFIFSREGEGVGVENVSSSGK